jgi:hypothetical protein
MPGDKAKSPNTKPVSTDTAKSPDTKPVSTIGKTENDVDPVNASDVVKRKDIRKIAFVF